MGIDRTSDGSDAIAETVEGKPDRPPPPPPDKPGTDGYPSRADSRIGAATANDTNAQTADELPEEKLETSRPSQDSGEQESAAVDGKPEAPGTSEVSKGDSLSRGVDVSGRHYETKAREADTGGTLETEQRPEEAGNVGGRKQRLNRQATPHDADKSTTDFSPTSEALPAAEIGDVGNNVRADDSATGRDDATLEVEEPAGYLSDAPVNGQTSLQRPHIADDDAERTGDRATDDEDFAGRDKRPDGRLTVDGKRMNEYLDPLDGADAGSDIIGEPWADSAGDLPPTGEELLKKEGDAKSRPEKIRSKFFEVIEDAHDITGKAADKGHDIFAPPPTGRAETSTALEVAQAPHDGINAGDMATGLFVLGTLISEGIRWGRVKMRGRK